MVKLENIEERKEQLKRIIVAEEELSKAEEIESYDLIFVCHSPDYVTSSWGVLYQSYFDCCKALYNSKTTTQKLIPDMRNTPIHMKYNGETI